MSQRGIKLKYLTLVLTHIQSSCPTQQLLSHATYANTLLASTYFLLLHIPASTYSCNRPIFDSYQHHLLHITDYSTVPPCLTHTPETINHVFRIFSLRYRRLLPIGFRHLLSLLYKGPGCRCVTVQHTFLCFPSFPTPSVSRSKLPFAPRYSSPKP